MAVAGLHYLTSLASAHCLDMLIAAAAAAEVETELAPEAEVCHDPAGTQCAA